MLGATRRAVLVAAVLITASQPGPSMAIEEPAYQLLHRADGYELRRYGSVVVAELEIEGTFEGAGNDAFRPLAAFIGGENTGPEKIGMTAPVIQQTVGDHRYVVQFVMPERYSPETLSRPIDERIRLREEPARVVAVARYSGTWSEKHYRDRLDGFQRTTERDGLTVTGDPVWARFNSPFSLWFLRRNEIWLPVAQPVR